MKLKWKCADTVILAALMLIYSILSFIGLGETSSPTSGPALGDGTKKEYITYIAFPAEEELGTLWLYKGLGRCGVTVYTSDDGGHSWEEIARQVLEDIYVWQPIELSVKTSLVCLSFGGDESLELYEAGFRSTDGHRIEAVTDGCPLFDEQDLVPFLATNENGMIFDETYHVRTAYEHIEGMKPYEISHPPLGKLLIGVGIRIFGMNPFGWRVMGNLFGILMLAVLYDLGRRLFGSRYWGAFAAILLALDFMHFTQTRIGLIDSFAVFFILLMYDLMYIYFAGDPETLPYKKSLVVLGLCGAVFGLGVASKWIAVYGGIGLAVLFAIALRRRAKAGEKWLPTCLWCLLFFIGIPALIYFLSYIPYFLAEPDRSPFAIFLDNQIYMLTYHGGLAERHDFESKWYTWPLIVRPMWYYGSKALAYEGYCSTIAAMGNPAVWWTGSLASLGLLAKPKKTRGEGFVLIGLAAQFLPWALIARSTFIYHFFASVPFIILALTFVLKGLSERFRSGPGVALRCLPWIVIAAALLLFVLFYPVISGCLADRGYVLKLLTWFDTWKLCY